jgi:DNA-binding transcriptional regulator YiaG
MPKAIDPEELPPTEMREVRELLGLSRFQIGTALGFTGNRYAIKNNVGRMERGQRQPTAQVSRLLEMYRRHGVPPEWLPY